MGSYGAGCFDKIMLLPFSYPMSNRLAVIKYNLFEEPENIGGGGANTWVNIWGSKVVGISLGISYN